MSKMVLFQHSFRIWLFGVFMPLLAVEGIAVCIIQQRYLAFEEPLMLAVHEHSGITLVRIAIVLHWLGKWPLAGVLVTALAWYEWHRKRLLRVAFVLLGTVVPVVLMSVVKSFFGRARPELWPRAVVESSSSFPSGHSTFAAALALTVVVLCWHRPYRVELGAAALVFAVLSGYARVVLGVHYPTDVLAGWLVGVGTVVCLQQIMRRKISLR